MIGLKEHDWHTLVMVLCFVYGGVSLVFFITQFTTIVQFSERPSPPPPMERMAQANFSDAIHLNATFRDRPFEPRANTILYIHTLLSFFGAIVAILAGFSLLDLLRKKERKELTKGLIDTMTTPEEKAVIKELEGNEGELTQSELVRRTGLSKVKVHRVIKRLASLGVVSKYPYGVTNKIKLNSSVYKEKRE